MTNWEKFKETFRIPDTIEPIDGICDIVSCEYVSCKDCIFGHEVFWSEEYKEEKDDTNN